MISSILFVLFCEDSSGRLGADPEQGTPGQMCNFAWTGDSF
jgi:hypothetical protein